MGIDVSRVLATSWAMFKERFWVIVGMVAVYFVIQVMFQLVGTMVMGGSFAALRAAAGGFEEGDALMSGLGIGMIVFLVLYYVAYFVLLFAQQGSMMALATPLHRTDFGEALMVGLRCIVPFLLVTLLLGVIYGAVALVGVGLSMALGEWGVIAMLLVVIPVIVWLALRLSVIVPVIAVDGTRGPIDAISRTWAMTSGKALGILVVYLVLILVAILVFAIPLLLMVGPLMGLAGGEPSGAAVAGAIGGVLLGALAFIPAYLIYSVASTAMIASIHAELTDAPASEAAETFS